MSSHTLSLLSDADNLTDFDCGDADLNEFLQNDAKENQKNWLSATRILYDNNKIIGYFTLIADTLNRERVNEPDRVEGYTYSKYSCIKLARLAVDKRYQNQGIGKELMIYVFAIARKIVNYEGGKFLTVDAKNSAVDFYRKFGFVPVRSQKNADTIPMYADFPHVFEQVTEYDNSLKRYV